MIKTALISVYDKTGIIEFAKELTHLGIKIYSTGGTALMLKNNGIDVHRITTYTEFPELMDGRVKTLHPKVHAGLLCMRNNKRHLEEAKKYNIELFDLVVVNLYPFEQVIKKDVKIEEAIENIDIGGPTLVRAAAKNYKYVTVVIEPEDYNLVLREIKKTGDVSLTTKKLLACKAFAHIAHYDIIINNYLHNIFGLEEFPQILNLTYRKVMDLRYGENPHQKAAFYKALNKSNSIVTAKQLHGKKLSFNNILDTNDAFELVKEFKEPTAAIIKHTNPCGVASRDKIEDAFIEAYNCDPISAYGSVIALNRSCNLETAKLMKGKFIEVLIAPGFEPEALKFLKETKKNIRLLECPITKERDYYEFKKVQSGLLLQTSHYPIITIKNLKVVTKREPTKTEIKDMIFAWNVCKHVKSNSIVFAKNKTTVGIGAGQMSRVDASIIAVRKSGDKAKGAVMSSDAFFPFRDAIDEAAKAGITAIVQPGGSIRDKEVIDAANEHNIAMVFTGIRLFKH